MNKKIIFLILFFIFVIISCTTIKKITIPKLIYDFNEPLVYNTFIDMELEVKSILVKYKGNLKVNTEIFLKAVETNEFGTKLLVDLNNLDVKGNDGIFNTLFTLAINFFKKWFSEIFVDTYGKVTVLFNNRPHPGLSLMGQFLFPFFYDINQLFQGQTISANYLSRLDNQVMNNTISIFSIIKNFEYENIFLSNEFKIVSYDSDEYFKNTNITPLGIIQVDYNDNFNITKGKLIYKTGTIKIDYKTINNLIKSGFIGNLMKVDITGSGVLEMKYNELNKAL